MFTNIFFFKRIESLVYHCFSFCAGPPICPSQFTFIILSRNVMNYYIWSTLKLKLKKKGILANFFLKKVLFWQNIDGSWRYDLNFLSLPGCTTQHSVHNLFLPNIIIFFCIYLMRLGADVYNVSPNCPGNDT